jgi:hypothetical protein
MKQRITFEELAYKRTLEDIRKLYLDKTGENFSNEDLICSLKEDWKELKNQKIENLFSSEFNQQKEIPRIQAKKDGITYDIYLIDHGIIAEEGDYVNNVKTKIASLNNIFVEQNFSDLFGIEGKCKEIPDHSVLNENEIKFNYFRELKQVFSRTNLALELGLINREKLRDECDKLAYSHLLPFNNSDLPPMVAVDLYFKGIEKKGESDLKRSAFQTDYIMQNNKEKHVNIFVGFDHGYQIKYFIENSNKTIN